MIVVLLLACGGGKALDTADDSAPPSATATGAGTGTTATGAATGGPATGGPGTATGAGTATGTATGAGTATGGTVHTGDTADTADSAIASSTTDTGDSAPDPVEVCGSGLDDDYDGLTDCDDDDCGCTVACFAGRVADAPNLLVNGGFEDPDGTPVAGALPEEPGVWVGDAALPTPDVPYEGGVALALAATGPAGAADDRADLVQVVSATEVRGDRLCIGAAVRRVAGDAETDTAFELHAWSFFGTPDTLASSWDALLATDCAAVGSCAGLATEAPPDVWTVVVGELFVTPTPGEASIAVRVSAVEDVVDDPSLPELDGHTVDAVWLYAP